MTAENQASLESNLLLDQMKKQHQIYCGQRDQAIINFQQLIGAIHALESLIKNHEEGE